MCRTGSAGSFHRYPSPAHARPAYAKKEGKECVYCHVVPGGPRNFRGLYYGAHNRSFMEFDNVFESKAAGVAANSVAGDAVPTVASYPDVKLPPALNFVVKDIDGNTVNLGRYQGKVVLVVNVASKCGNTPQYASLETLYEKYKSRGLVILGFPANEFLSQEPGDNKTIKEFCTSKYNVSFPMFSKIVVRARALRLSTSTLPIRTPILSSPVTSTGTSPSSFWIAKVRSSQDTKQARIR